MANERRDGVRRTGTTAWSTWWQRESWILSRPQTPTVAPRHRTGGAQPVWTELPV
jgi:hypothetical protein